MADFLGITQPSYSLIDRGATKVKDDFRIKICQEFGVDVEIFTTQIPFSEWFRFVNPDKNKEEKLQKDTGHLNAIKIIEEEEEVNKRNNAQEILLRIENEQLREENESKKKTIEKLRKELIEMADVAQCLREELRKIMSPEKLIPN
jgi:transcriptional regulator with XRE-family HTH domain